MGQLSYYADGLIINALLSGVGFTIPALYFTLYTTNPTASDIGIEVTGIGYARQTITFSAPSGGVVSNSADVIFSMALNSWPTITHAGIRDNSSGGHLLFYGPLSSPKNIVIGDVFKFNIGSIVCQVS